MAEVTITIPSTRIYMDELPVSDQLALTRHKQIYSAAKEQFYNIRYDQMFLDSKEQAKRNTPAKGKEILWLKAWLQRTYGFVPQEYHITSLYGHANGMLSSQKELIKLRQQELSERIKNRQEKIAKTQKLLETLQTIKENLMARSKAIKAGHKPKPVTLSKFHKKKFGQLVTEEDHYLYEIWIDKKIVQLKSKLSLLGKKQKRDIAKDLSVPDRITFGGKKLFKSKDTTDITNTEWHRLREHARTHMCLFSGRYNSKDKNWLCSYDYTKHIFTVSLIDGTKLSISNVSFPYRKSDLISVLTHPKESGWSVGYWFDFETDHNGREYLIIKASFTLCDDHMNYDTSQGVIGIDLNVDNISWADLDSNGCRIDGGIIRFDIVGKPSGQVTDILGRVSAQVMEICRVRKKPMAMENIDTSLTRNRMQYKNKRANAMASMFAYRKITQFLQSRAFKLSIGITMINPAYTSLIGKVKYMKHLRIPVHMSAAYVIGRRAMGFKEKMPAYLKQLIPDKKKRSHHWKQFAHIYTVCKKIPADTFYQTYDIFTDMKEFKTLQIA